MNGMKAEVFNSDYMLVKAETIGLDKDEILRGFYSVRRNEKGQEIPYIKEPTKDEFWEINAYTVCRNTGAKDKNGNYIFEYDLILYKDRYQKYRYGFAVWNEFYKSWRIHSSFIYGSSMSICDVSNIEVVGNVLFYKCDIEKIEDQDQHINDVKQNDNSYCPSKFRK
jgi:hypothetical protein